MKSDPAESEMKDEPSTSAETDDKQKKRKVVSSSQERISSFSRKVILLLLSEFGDRSKCFRSVFIYARISFYFFSRDR